MILLEILLVFGFFDLMGEIGRAFSNLNFTLFGILCFIYPVGVFYLGYLKYKTPIPKLRYIELWSASIFLFLLALILQALIAHIGIFGKAVIAFLSPYLGTFGIWILTLFGMGICFLSLSDKDPFELIKNLHLSQLAHQAKNACSKALFSLISKIKTVSQKFSLKWSPKKQIHHSPSIKLQMPKLQMPSPPNPILPTNKMTFAKMITSKTKENAMRDEKINIQEVIISHQFEEKKAQIRIVEQTQPAKENPFLAQELPIVSSNTISTSAELLKKIKNPHYTPAQTPLHQSKTPQTPLHPSMQAQQTPIESDLAMLNSQDFTPSHLNIDLSHPQETNTQEIPVDNALDFLPLEENYVQTPPYNPPLQEEMKTEETKTDSQISSFPSLAPQKSKIAHIKTLEENEALLKEIDQGKVVIPKDYKLPPLSLLSPAPKQEIQIDEEELDNKIQSLLSKLSMFKIDGDVIRTYSGPVITTLEYRPSPNVKVSRIQSLENDIAMALEAKSIRIQAPIPGKSVVGIEIPNSSVQTIYLREIFESEIFKNSASPLTLALGKDVVGNPFITDLKKLPHLLIAGTTGSGKSVGVNAMILSLLYRNSPDDLKLMMVDPKMVEFMPYSDLPHLITPIITDPKKAVIGLANAVKEMERRYTLMSQSRTKEIVSYNQKAEESGLEKFPYFVIIIDELADLMMTAGKEVEYSMARIAQMGRASGIHLIVATQSPRAEVLTGLIKTNLPAHLSYKVGTKIDAGIIGCSGAETLLGRGDMLFTPPGSSGLVRLHAPWSSESEVDQIVSYIKEQREAMYDVAFLPEEKEALGALDCEEMDPETAQLLEKAKQIISNDGIATISYLQRRLSIGYNKAATLIERLEKIGFISAPDAKGKRQIL